MEVDHHRIGVELVGELDCLEAVPGRPNGRELGPALDERDQRLQKPAVVVREEHSNAAARLDPCDFHDRSNASLVRMLAKEARKVAVIGAALDLGQGRRGVDMGPSAIRYAGLEARLQEIGVECVDWGNVEAAVAEAVDVHDERARYLPQVKTTCDRVAGLVEQAVGEGMTPLVLGGDHSIALGTLGGLARVLGAGGVLWIDAHADLNTPETSPSGNIHGMALAAALGRCGPDFGIVSPSVDPGRVALVGVRLLDPGEKALLRELDIRVYTMSDIDRIGIERAIRESLSHVAGPVFVHVSLDVDVVDPDVAPGVGTPVRGGLAYREAHLAMELVAEAGLATSLEVVEVNPILDRQNETAALAVELVASALGAKIL